ncbi:MAG: hypothetical protein Q9198_008336, partial [Flavoplaca austrocitrina]
RTMLTSTVLFLSVLPFCISLIPSPPPPPSPLALENEPLTILNIGNDTNPSHFYQASNAMDPTNFGLTTAWPPPQQRPPYFRPIPSGASMQILLSIITQSFAPLPPSEPVRKSYLEWSPGYRPNMNHLDTRIAIRQYRAVEWGPGAIGERILRNGDVAAAATILGHMYRRGQVLTEDAWRMCYVDGRQALSRCSGVVMVQRDVWVRG